MIRRPLPQAEIQKQNTLLLAGQSQKAEGFITKKGIEMKDKDEDDSVKKKYWYEFFYSECVLCGRRDDYKVRRYTPKPEKVSERYHFSQFACDEHFM